MEYFSIGKFAKETGKSIQTLRNWDKLGKLKPAHLGAGGARYYTRDQLNEFTGNKSQNERPRITIGYCRVSSSKQKDDLDRQIENVKLYMIAKGYHFDVIADIGSGINYNKPGLNELIDRIENYQVDKIVVLYKDRLLRFGYELIETLCNKHGTQIEIIDHTEKTQEQELVEDLVQIVTVFSCRLQGKRANKVQKMIKELIECDSCEENSTISYE